MKQATKLAPAPLKHGYRLPSTRNAHISTRADLSFMHYSTPFLALTRSLRHCTWALGTIAGRDYCTKPPWRPWKSWYEAKPLLVPTVTRRWKTKDEESALALSYHSEDKSRLYWASYASMMRWPPSISRLLWARFANIHDRSHTWSVCRGFGKFDSVAPTNALLVTHIEIKPSACVKKSYSCA